MIGIIPQAWLISPPKCCAIGTSWDLDVDLRRLGHRLIKLSETLPDLRRAQSNDRILSRFIVWTPSEDL
jgi:hypothetical protein